MRQKIIILVSLIAICGLADSIKFNETIYVEGNGGISARTTTDAAKDAVDGTGEQDYTRNLNLEESSTTLRSEYHLISNPQENTNHYYAQMNSPGGLEHFISVDSASGIDSVSTIIQSDNTVNTKYDIEAKMAQMSEKITKLDSSNDGKTKSEIAVTEVSGNFFLASDLSDDSKGVTEQVGFDADYLLSKLNDTVMTTEKPPSSVEGLAGEGDEGLAEGQEFDIPPREEGKLYVGDDSRKYYSKRSLVILGGNDPMISINLSQSILNNDFISGVL